MFGKCLSKFSHDQDEGITYTAFSASVVSLYASSFLIFTFLRFGSFKSKYHLQIIFYLAIADFIWSAANIVGYGAYVLKFYPLPLEMAGDTATCVIRGFYQLFAASSICWSESFAVYLFWSFYTYKKVTRQTLLVFHLYSWGVPAILMVVLVIFLRDKTNPYCEPSPEVHFWVWGMFIIVGFLFNLIVYISVLRKYFATVKMVPTLDKHLLSLRLSLFVVAFLLCWLFNVVSIIIDLLKFSFCEVYWIAIIFNLFLNSSGTLNCLVYGITTKTMRANYVWWSALGWFLVSPLCIIPAGIARAYKQYKKPQKKHMRTIDQVKYRSLPIQENSESVE